MKKLLYISIVLFVFTCDSENANDCIQKAGAIVSEERDVVSFEKILVNRNIEMILKQEDTFKVMVESGENLLNDIEVEVVGNTLELTDNNTCNYVRDYGLTKIYVSAPDVIEIRSSTQYDISSQGVLNYENVALKSEDFNATGTFTTGDFRLQLVSNTIEVVTNNLSTLYLTGSTERLKINFASGAGRFFGENLIAQEISIYHRGNNDMIVNPQVSISGQLVSTGDVIAVNEPSIVEVEELYVGRLIFQD
jgi:hypothetical protein